LDLFDLANLVHHLIQHFQEIHLNLYFLVPHEDLLALQVLSYQVHLSGQVHLRVLLILDYL